MKTETEAKFTCPPEVLDIILSVSDLNGAYALSEPYPYPIEDIYLDTKDLKLISAGASLRVRRSRGKYLLTLKTRLEKTGTSLCRREIEEEVSPEEAKRLLDTGEMPYPFNKELYELAGPDPIEALLEVSNDRVIRNVFKDSNLLAELSLDRVTFRRGKSEERLCGIELELKDYSGIEAFERLIAIFVKRFPALEASSKSKYELGMKLMPL